MHSNNNETIASRHGSFLLALHGIDVLAKLDHFVGSLRLLCHRL